LISNIYGSSRVGIKNTNKRVTALAYNLDGNTNDSTDIIIPETINPLDPVKRSLGEKQYELSNHLGNVLVTVSDRKLAEGTEGSTASGYRAEVLFASDYYPFGMQMPGREFSAEEYRYGFNGMEKDDELAGEGNSYTTHFRQYDSRIGRWQSTDPVKKANKSPYETNSNRPTTNTDPNGDCDDCPPPELSFGIGYTFGTHNNGLSINFSLTQSVNNFEVSMGGSLTGFASFNNTGKSGLEYRASIKAGFNDGFTNLGLGTNIWGGFGGMTEFKQRTGILTMGFGKFSASYENDGYPFNLGLKNGLNLLGTGEDSHRTAAVQLQYGEFQAGFNLFTGVRTSFEGDDDKVAYGKEHGPITGDFGEKMPFGYVNESNPQYRMGAAYLGYGSIKLGLESDRWIRHSIQDNFAHVLNPQPGFKSLSDKVSPYMQSGNSNFSLPNFSLYD
jgi:RHS repeat-associated protein